MHHQNEVMLLLMKLFVQLNDLNSDKMDVRYLNYDGKYHK